MEELIWNIQIWGVSPHTGREELVNAIEIHQIKLQNFMKRKEMIEYINSPEVYRFEITFVGYEHE